MEYWNKKEKKQFLFHHKETGQIRRDFATTFWGKLERMDGQRWFIATGAEDVLSLSDVKAHRKSDKICLQISPINSSEVNMNEWRHAKTQKGEKEDRGCDVLAFTQFFTVLWNFERYFRKVLLSKEFCYCFWSFLSDLSQIEVHRFYIIFLVKYIDRCQKRRCLIQNKRKLNSVVS